MAKVGTAEYDVEISRAAVQREVDQASRQIERGFGDSAKKVKSEYDRAIKGALVGFGAVGAARFLNDSVQAASNLAEQQTKSITVFGQSQAAVQEFADTASAAYGQSERA